MSQTTVNSNVVQAIPEGYKQSVAGVIPKEWNSLTLGDVCNFVGGAQPEKSTFSHKPQRGYIRLIQIRDYKSDKHIVYIPEKLARKKCDIDDIMIGRYGPPIFQILRGIKGAYNVALIKAIPLAGIEIDFLYYFLKNEKLFELMDMLSQRSSGQTGVELPALKSYPIGIPPVAEQTAIANVLSDMDGLLSELENLITKKQAIKTASMQQLLTGKTRLPAFSTHPDGTPKGTKPSELGDIPEDWEVIGFGDLFERNITRKKISAEKDVTFIGMQAVSENAKLISPSNIAYKSVKSGFTYFERNDVLVAKITPCFENGKGCFTENITTEIGFGSTEFHVLRATKQASSKYIYYITVTEKFRNELESEMVGSAGHRRVPLSAVQCYQIPASRNKDEQIAIANILSDMDEEIQTLEQRLNKTQQIKQGMMQELLTGKTRLI